MAAVANNPKFAKKVGIPQSVGEDYVEADKGRKLRSGGMAGCGTKRMSKGGMSMAAGKGYRRGGKTEIEPKMTTYKSRVKPLPLQPSRLEPRPEPRPIQPPMPRPEPRPEPRPTGNQNPLPQTQPPPRGYKAGGKVRGAGMCKKGVRPCKMV